jgi:nucleoprotein TPR
LQNQIRDLQQRVEDMSDELTSVNQELSEARKSELEKLQHLENEKSLLESQLNSLKEDLEKTTAAAQYHQEDLRRQAGIAQEAQQNYERELVKHADAARTLQQLRNEYAELKNEVHSFKTEAETAKASLSFNESSWETQRESYQKELNDVKARCDDLVKQNKILHGQFDKVNEQMTELKKERAYRDEAMEVSPEGQTLDKSMEDLREVIRYLRQEKEIVDVQYELSLQETKRLKQQLDYARSQLEETKVQLATEKGKQGDQLRGVAEHKEIMEKISELNLLRESNSTLRYDGEKKAKKVAELSAKIEELEAKIQPLEQSVRELEAEKEVKDAQMKLLNEDNERWKARTQQILQKYDRVDPAELEELKQKATTLESERDELQQKVEASGAEKETQLQEQATQWRGRIAKLRDDANGKIVSLRTKTQELTQEIETLRGQLETSRASEQAAVTNGGEELQRVREEKERLEGEVKALQEKATTAENQCNMHRTKAQQFYRELVGLPSTLHRMRANVLQGEFKKEKQQTTEEFQALRSQLENVKAELETVKAREQALIEQLASKSAGTNGATAADHSDEQMLARVQELQRQNEELQARVQVSQPIETVVDNTEEIEAEVQRRVAEIEASIQANVEAEVQRRVEEFQPTQNTEEGEVVDSAQPVPAPSDMEPAQAVAAVGQLSDEEIEARVAARVEEVLPARMQEKFAEKEKVLQDRIKTAQLKFQDYKTAAVKKAVEECEAKHKGQHEASQKRIAELEAEISNLKLEIEQLRAKIAELESRPATNIVETGIKQEDMDAALAAKDAEHQSAITALRAKPDARFEEAKEALRMEIQAEMLTIQQNIDGAEVTPEAAATRDKEKEKLKVIISRNVEHRLNKEREKWRGEIEAQRESLIDEKVQAALKEKTAELEAKMQEKEATLKAEMEKSKDAIRQEGVMRSKVQINMLERKNKMLEEKLKASQGGDQAVATPATAPPAPTATMAPQPPTQQLTTGIRRPSTVNSAVPQPAREVPTPSTQTPNLQAAQQAAIAAAEQAIAAASPAQRRGENQGTGPGALRQLRGALGGSGIPRGGAVSAGRGRGSPSQAGSPTQPPQQPVQPGQPQPSPFAGQIPASGIPNPFAGAQGQQGRGGGIPRGRGGFAGRGRGQQVHTVGIPQPGQPAAGSPTRSGGQMNPSARQFVPPGSKRTREGGEDEGSEGKRVRSSVGGGGPAPVGGVQQ